jgi:hypothetical protein
VPAGSGCRRGSLTGPGPPRGRDRSQRAVFQERAQAARGGLEVLPGQPAMSGSPARTNRGSRRRRSRHLSTRGHRIHRGVNPDVQRPGGARGRVFAWRPGLGPRGAGQRTARRRRSSAPAALCAGVGDRSCRAADRGSLRAVRCLVVRCSVLRRVAGAGRGPAAGVAGRARGGQDRADPHAAAGRCAGGGGVIRAAAAAHVRTGIARRPLGCRGRPARRVGTVGRGRVAEPADVRTVPRAAVRRTRRGRPGPRLGGTGDHQSRGVRRRLGPARGTAGARDGSAARSGSGRGGHGPAQRVRAHRARRRARAGRVPGRPPNWSKRSSSSAPSTRPPP